MNDALAPEGPLAKQLAYLEKMHPGDGPYFNNQVSGWVGGWMSEWVGDWVSEWVTEWMIEWVCDCLAD